MPRFAVRSARIVSNDGGHRAVRRGAVAAALPVVALACATFESALLYLAAQMSRAGQAFLSAGGF